MANAEAGSAYISIIPSMKGFDSKLSSGISEAVGKVGKVAAAAFAAVGAGAAAAGKAALDSYSDYEQLSGGIEKIFGDAAGQVQEYASQAYVAAGLSANDYMRQVSSFSASLKQSFGGDVVAAAERANMAMVDMSDNANVFGSNIEDVQNAMKGLLAPKFREVLLGHATVRSPFKVSGVGTIAGSYVTDGKIQRNAQIRLLRDNIVIHEGKIYSLKRFKDDAKEVNTGYECGIGIENYNDIKENDVIECFIMEEVEK